MGRHKAKVFCIGFHKTGTSSLRDALRLLGYRVTGPNWVNEPDIAQTALQRAIDLVPRYDAFQDNPWPLLFRELDEQFPGSRFILTIRPTEKWLSSIVTHFAEAHTPMRDWIYAGVGAPKGNEETYRERYERHNRDVREYFAQRPEALLEIDVTSGGGWNELCPFLGVKRPWNKFPHANPAALRSDKWSERAIANTRSQARHLAQRAERLIRYR